MKSFSWLLVVSLFLLVGCGKEPVFIPGPPGPQGEQGAPGQDGKDGKDGTSCTVVSIPKGDVVLPNGGAIVQCGDTSVLISNGADGLNGQDGTDGEDGQNATQSAYAIVDLINPCGDAPNIDDEIFLKLTNGTMLWLQIDNNGGKNPRLAIARPGTWVTTDGDSCAFTLNADGTITNESKR